jgi:hypothetical protein
VLRLDQCRRLGECRSASITEVRRNENRLKHVAELRLADILRCIKLRE